MKLINYVKKLLERGNITCEISLINTQALTITFTFSYRNRKLRSVLS